MKRIHVWYAAFTLAIVITGWYVDGLVLDLMGYNVVDPSRHFNLWEFVWCLVFATAAIISLWQIKKLRPSVKDKPRST